MIHVVVTVALIVLCAVTMALALGLGWVVSSRERTNRVVAAIEDRRARRATRRSRKERS